MNNFALVGAENVLVEKPVSKTIVHERSFGLDLMRTIAIVLVLISHFAKQYEHIGFWGVELFFGLSGFLIGQILWRSYSTSAEWSGERILNFWSRRWWRTLPNYYLFVIVMLVFHFFNGGLPTLIEFFEYLWFKQNLLSRSGQFFGVSWSLCIEEWFYLIFPVILFVFSKFKLKAQTAFICTLLFFFIGSAILRAILLNQGESSLRGITLARLDSIACGVSVAFIFSIIKETVNKKILAFLLGIILLTAAFVMHYLSDSGKENQVIFIVVPMGFSLLLPYVNLLPWPKGLFTLFGSWVEKISLWSYSLYLSHIPIMFLVYYLLNDIRGNSIGNLASKIIALIITIAVSGFLFKYFELPLTRKRPKEIK